MGSSKLKCLTSIILLLLTQAGCAPQYSVVYPNPDVNFGSAVNAAKATQILRPYAWQNPEPVIGLDGYAAEAAFNSYQKSYRDPVPQNLDGALSGTIGRNGR